jgi:hypothetical protein
MPGIYGDGTLFDGYCKTPGVPATNSLKIATLPANGETVSITNGVLTETYEFRDTTPPAGGTAGRWWIYIGAGDPAQSRQSLVCAINDCGNALRVTPPAGGHVLPMFAVAGDAADTINVFTAETPGGQPVGYPSSTLWLSYADTLGAAADIWDSNTVSYGSVAAPGKVAIGVLQITVAMIAKGSVAIPFPFANAKMILVSMNRAQNEPWSVVSGAGYSYALLTLAGGASPNNQSGDYISVMALQS